VYTKKRNQEYTILGFTGDVMIGRMVNEIIKKKSYSYPWGNSLPLLAQADLRIINLETTLTTHAKKNPKVFNFKALPDRVKTLQSAHIDIINLANNHSLDFQEEGLAETIATLDAAGIHHVGAGANIEKACKPFIIIKNGIKIGIIGYTDNEPTWKASDNKPGINYIRVGDIDTIKNQIATLRPLVDIVIISSHWGPNMVQVPSSEFVEFAHAIIDSGADIIHGHSSHIFQGIEIYKNKIIMYDTGDFINDYAVDPQLRNDQSLFFAITIAKNGPISIALTPVIIKNMQVSIANGTEKEEIMLRIQQLSQQFNTTISRDGIINIYVH
jgi:poly-gamma-glutamate synthesis protein (capsule biosynthesis protein)